MLKLKIKKGDNLIVIAGKDKGKQGKVLAVFPKENKAIISGINIVKKHTKPTQSSEGGIILKEMPIHISNVAHIDRASGKPTKVGIKILSDGSKIRVAKKSNEAIDQEAL